VTPVDQPAPPTKARRPRNQRLRLIAVSLLTIAVYFAVLTVMLPGGSAVAAKQVANALTLGAIYSLVALGYTMVYGIIELINFAHGDVFMVGTFMSLFFLASPPKPLNVLGLHLTGTIAEPLVLVVVLTAAFLFGMTVMGLINLAIERLAYRPLRHASRLAPLITAIGVSLLLQNVMQIVVGTGDRPVPQLFPAIRFDFLGASIPLLNFFILIVALVLMAALQLFVNRTRLGRAMRATAQNQQSAQLMGVDLNQTIAMTFLIGGALAGAAGVFQGQYFGFVRFDLGFNAGLKAFTAAVLGGIGNLGGAVLGGFAIAFIEVFAQANGQARWSQALLFLVLILVLLFRPAGILGQQIGERA